MRSRNCIYIFPLSLSVSASLTNNPPQWGLQSDSQWPSLLYNMQPLSLVCCEIFIGPLQGTVYSAFGLLIVPWVDLRVLSSARPRHKQGHIIIPAHCASSAGARFCLLQFLSYVNMHSLDQGFSKGQHLIFIQCQMSGTTGDNKIARCVSSDWLRMKQRQTQPRHLLLLTQAYN